MTTQKEKERLNFHLITSKVFWVGAPMIISEIIKRDHYFSVFDELALPPAKTLLDCDVFIDTSTITRRGFYLSLLRELARRKIACQKVPLMVDPPESIMNSFDKRRTHEIFPDLTPESYNLTGRNNRKILEKFKDDEYLVVKDPLGWWGESVERVTPTQATKNYDHSKNLIVQKYVPFEKGVGRIVTINHANDFEIACSYLRIPKSWRTGVDIAYKCVQEPVSKELRDFAHTVSTRCGLYLNGIDYIQNNGRYVLLEVNAVPAMKEPYDEFQIDIPRMLISHIEKQRQASQII
jgi:glutathione synthase/RimK-type ligase-like ATP-grasp enzyme